jgi:transposase
LSHGVPRVDDRRIISGIIFIIRNGLRWRDAPKEYGPHKTIYKPLHPLEPARRVQPDLRRAGGERREARSVDDRCDAPQSAPDGGQPAQKGDDPRRIGRTKGGLNSKLHAVCDGQGRPLIMLLSEGQMSDYKARRS